MENHKKEQGDRSRTPPN